MNAILFSRRHCKIRHFDLSHPMTLGVIGMLALGLLAGTFAAGLMLGEHKISRAALLGPAAALRSERQQMAGLRAQMQDKVDALAMRLGTVNAHLMRLNALGKQLTQMANINGREFDFDHDPPQGGSNPTAWAAPPTWPMSPP